MAPSTHNVATDRAPSARTLSGVVIGDELFGLWVKNRKVYGVRKICKAARRSGLDIGRDETARLMR